MAVRIHIERLTIDERVASGLDAEQVGDQVRSGLASRFAASGAFGENGDRAGPAATTPRGSGADSTGPQRLTQTVAETIRSSLR